MDKRMIELAEREIAKKCFLEVIPRFQNITEGTGIIGKKELFDSQDNLIELKPKALQYFKQNYSILYKAVILEWAKFLERINLGLPKLITKIESEEIQRRSLAKFKDILKKLMPRRLVVLDSKNKMLGIIAEKDIFQEISKGQTLITSFIGGNYPAEYREVYARFTVYMFDLLPKL